jgi:NAD dependent epimerase/dehydratase family enzyme
VEDAASLLIFAVENLAIQGALNATAPVVQFGMRSLLEFWRDAVRRPAIFAYRRLR